MVLANRTRVQNSRTLLRAFGGLNEGYGCSEAEYSAGINFSSRDFPALSTRKPRRKLRTLTGLNGMYHLNGLLTVCGKDLVYTPDDGGETVTCTDAVADSKKALVGLGTKILIFPDKVAFDTADGSVSALGACWKAEGQSVEFAPCDAEGRTYTPTGVGREEPESPADGQIFLKVEDEEHPWRYDGTLEVYSAASGNWTALPLDYCRITAAGAQEKFCQWDTVTVQGTAAKQAGQWEALDGDCVVYAVTENSLCVRADPAGDYFYGTLVQGTDAAQWTSLDGSQTRSIAAEQTVQLERRVPDLDFVTECDNRVWGCSSRENVIYACKLGDPTNWFSYRGIAADSYAVTVGSDGAFTGAATCMGYALFFKENTLHKLCGTKPSDFQLTSLRCRGVAKNAARSLCVLNETLYYLSPDGVMAWDGSIPTKVSAVLDASRLANVQSAVGGALDGRYYLHISRTAGTQGQTRLLVYDTERGLWHEEDVCSCDMASTGGQLYLWDGQALWAADPSRESDWQSTEGVEQQVSFELVTGDIGQDGAEQRYLSRLTLRLDAACASTVEVALSYDGGPWETVASLTAQEARRSYDLPLVPRRHSTLRLRLRGKGQITLRSLAKNLAAAKGGLWKNRRKQHGKCERSEPAGPAEVERKHGPGGRKSAAQLPVPDAGTAAVCTDQSGRGKPVGGAAHPVEFVVKERRRAWRPKRKRKSWQRRRRRAAMTPAAWKTDSRWKRPWQGPVTAPARA